MARVFVSSVVGGTSAANREVVAAIGSLAQCSQSVSDATEIACNLHIVFKVAGPFAAPDFDGVVPGRWSEPKQQFKVQIAVPENLHGEGAAGFLVRQLNDARDVTTRRLRSRLEPPAIETIERAFGLLIESLG